MKGLYLYGIRARHGSLPKLKGIEQGTRVFAVESGSLEALASAVRAAGPAAWERRCTADLRWVRAAVLRHHVVVQRLQRISTILPLKFGALVFQRTRAEAERALRRALTRQAGAVGAVLQRVAGKEEWGVILAVDEGRFAAWVAGREAAPRRRSRPGSAGQEWHREQKRAARVQAAREAATERIVTDLVERLRPVADALAGHEPPPAPAGEPGRRLVALACLVARPRVPEFQKVLRRLEPALAAQGFALQTTGPWAPYHFVDLPEVGEPARVGSARSGAVSASASGGAPRAYARGTKMSGDTRRSLPPSALRATGGTRFALPRRADARGFRAKAGGKQRT